MDPLALLVVGGLVLVGQKLNKEKYRTGLFVDRVPVADNNASQILYNLQGTRNEQQYGGGIQISSPEQITQATGLVQIKKTEIPSFQVVAPDASKDVYRQPSYNLQSTSSNYIKNVKNNESPFPIQQVGRGLGIGANVPAAGGFHQDYRILTTNINDQNLVQLPGPGSNLTETSMPSGAVVPSGPLASGVSGYSSGGPLNQPPSITTFPRTNVGYVEPAPGGGASYPTAPDGIQSKTQRATLKDQSLAPSIGGIRHSLVPNMTSMTNNVIKSTNRSQAVPNVMPGGQSLGSSTSGDLTTLSNDQNSIPRGYSNGSKYGNYGDIPSSKFNPFKGNENPIQPNSTTAQMANRNPFIIPSFAQP